MMRFLKTIFLCFFTLVLLAIPPSNSINAWKSLSDVTFDLRYDEEYDYNVEVPVFGPKVLELDGSTIKISGYMIPMDGIKKQNYFILSAFPYASCYFCGGAGPETVMEVYTKKPVPYTTRVVSVKGRLELNDGDINQLIYILRDAEPHY